MSEELINAIEDSDSNRVLELLKNGADPNYYDGDTLPLIRAIENMNEENDGAEDILQYLLDFGANPFETGDEDDEDNLCPLEYVLENDFEDAFLLLFAHIKKTKRLPYFKLQYAATASSSLLLFLIKEGVRKNPERALTRRLDYYNDIKYPDITMLDFTVVKLLYDLGGIKYSDHIYYYHLFMFALMHGRYDFAYQCYMNSDVKTGVYEENSYRDRNRRIAWLLTAEQAFNATQPSEVDRQRIALILSCLCDNNGSFTRMINLSKQYFQDDETQLFKNGFNNDLVGTIESINHVLYNAVVIFLNPIQSSVFETLQVHFRFKLAKEYLKNEIGSLIDFLDDHKLDEILTHRILHYFYTHRTKIFKQTLSKKILSLNVSTDIMTEIHTKISSFIDNASVCNWSLNFRQHFLAQLDAFGSENAEIKYLNHILKIYSELNKNESKRKLFINNTIYKTVINTYSLRYFIKNQDPNNVSKILDSDSMSSLSKSYTDLMQSLENDNTAMLKLSEESFTWFEKFMLEYCIKNYDENKLAPILNDYYNDDLVSQKTILETLLRHKRFNLFITFLKESHCLRDEYLYLIKYYLKYIDKNILSSLILKIIDNETYISFKNMLPSKEKIFQSKDYESYLITIFRTILLIIAMEKKPSLLTLVHQIFMATPISNQLQTTIKSFSAPLEFPIDKNELAILDKIDSHKLDARVDTTQYFYYMKDENFIKDYAHHTVSVDGESLKKRVLFKYFLPKVYYRSISNCLASCLSQYPSKKTQNLTWSPQENYKKLITSLREPTYLPKACYDNFMAEKGIDHLTHMPQILTQREKLAYLTLMHANWKLTHRVKKYDDFLKIQREGKILSIAQRKRQNLFTNNKNTYDVPSEAFVFLTLGPEKSPCPRFLKDCGGFEIDINQLLEKYPDFLDYGYLTYHLYSFTANQTYSPRIFNEKIWNIHFSEGKQFNEYYHENEKYTLVNDPVDGVFSGKRVIHILSLLFIRNLRAIRGSVYEYVLQNANNVEVLSDVFGEIIHPGIFEFRYPGVVPLDDNYTRVLSFSTAKKYYQECELDQIIVSPASLQVALADGLDLDQPILLTYQKNNKTCYDVGNLLSWAILKNKTDIKHYLLENTKSCLSNDKYTLTPFEAAQKMGDGETLLNLLDRNKHICHGIREFPFIPADILSQIIDRLDDANLTMIVKSIPFFYGLEILRCLISSHSILLENRIAILPLIHILLQNLLNDERYARKIIIKSLIKLNHELITPLLLEYIFNIESLRVNIFEFLSSAILLKQTCFIEMSLKRISFHESVNLPNYQNFLFKLALSGHVELFVEVLSQISLDDKIYLNKISFQQALTLFLDLLGQCQNEIYDEIISIITHDGKDQNESWINQECLQIFLIELLKNKHFKNYLKNLLKFSDFFELIKMKCQNFNLIDATKYLIEIDHKYKDYFLANWIKYLACSTSEEFDALFTLLTDTSQCHLILFETCNFMFSEKMLSFIVSMISLYSMNYRHCCTLEVILANRGTMIPALELAIKNNSVNDFISLLLFITDSEEMLRFFLKNISEYIKTFIVENRDSLVLDINHTLHPCKDRLQRILQELLPEIPHDIAMNRTEIWLKGIKQTDAAPPCDRLPLSLWEKYLQANPSKHSCLSSKSSAVIFITCHINNEPHVFLGRKKNSLLKDHLMASGGRLHPGEDSFLAAMREAIEETKLDMFGSKEALNILQYLLKWVGGRTFCKFYNDQNTLLPTSISLLHKYYKVDNLSGKEKFYREIFFYWFELSPEQNTHLIASDDFSDGVWIPMSCLKYRPDTSEYYYGEFKVLKSNAMLIEMIQGKPISRTLLDEEIYFEGYNYLQKLLRFSQTFSSEVLNSRQATSIALKRKLNPSQQDEHIDKKFSNSN